MEYRSQKYHAAVPGIVNADKLVNQPGLIIQNQKKINTINLRTHISFKLTSFKVDINKIDKGAEDNAIFALSSSSIDGDGFANALGASKNSRECLEKLSISGTSLTFCGAKVILAIT